MGRRRSLDVARAAEAALIAILVLAALAQLPTGEPVGAPARYDELVALGVAEGKLGHRAQAAEALAEAIALDPGRPEALVERGGLRFLDRDYASAVADFRRALARREDPYTREMLAASLHLAGRSEAALREWNRLGQPILAHVEVSGPPAERVERVRRELVFVEGQRLTAGQVEQSRLRLEETGLFGRVRVAPVPRPAGRADVDVSVLERRGLFAWGVAEFVGQGVADAIRQMARFQYHDAFGSGATFGAAYRWERTQPLLAFSVQWARPLGVPVSLQARAARWRSEYDLGSPLTLRAHGGDLGLRRVLGARTVAGLAFQTHDRSFSREQPDARPGRVAGLELVLEQRVLRSDRETLDLGLRCFRTASWLGSDLAYARGLGRARWSRVLAGAAPEAVLPGTQLAAQLQWGIGGAGMPLDAMFAPGAAAEMDLPLRGHRQKVDGILGSAPIGRNVILTNLELRQRVWSSRRARGGVVLFYDVARAHDLAQGTRDQVLHDIGIGARLAIQGALTLRMDFGRSLSGDGKSALTLGIGQVF